MIFVLSVVHVVIISLNFRSSKGQGCDRRDHRNICDVLSAASPRVHVVSPLK